MKRHELAQLDPSVPESAIDLLDKNYTQYCCLAMSAALYYKGLIFPEDAAKYKRAFKKHCTRFGMFRPSWWNSPSRHEFARVRALESFRDAIIKAKKPRRKFLDWLFAPYQYSGGME